MIDRQRHASRGITGLAVLLPLALALVTSFAVTPEDIESGRVSLTPTCTFRQIFGRPCPTCGLTRGFSALSHGRVDEASRYNVLSVPMYAIFWLGAVASAFVATRSAIGYARARGAGPDQLNRSRPEQISGSIQPEPETSA